MPTAARTADVIIVGAGIAGLAAASALTEQGYNVKILEATHHIGGRIKTTKLANGAIVDEGAHWVHTPDINPVTHIVRDERIACAATDPAKKLHYLGGRPLSAHKLQGFLDAVTDKLEHKGYTYSEIKKMSVLDAIKATYPMLTGFAHKSTATYNASDPAKMGMLEVTEDPYGSGGIQLKAGMESLVDNFANYVGYDSILTGRPVTKIQDDGNSVMLRTLNGEVWRAKHVIYTGSVATLKNNTTSFSPLLNQTIREKLNHLEMGDLCKITFQLDPAFARANPDLAHLRIDEHSQDTPMIMHVMGAHEPVLTVIVGTALAKQMEQSSPEEARAFLMKAMQRYEPLREVLKHVTDAPPHITNWGGKEYIGGAYSYMTPGAERTGPLSTWNNKLWIAGEAFDKEGPGAVPGAITSGIAAAECIMKLQERPQRIQRENGGHGR